MSIPAAGPAPGALDRGRARAWSSASTRIRMTLAPSSTTESTQPVALRAKLVELVAFELVLST